MITFVVQKRKGGNRRNLEHIHANLQSDLQDFFGGLRAFPYLMRLSDLCVYDDTFIDGEYLLGLRDDLTRVEGAMDAGVLGSHIPDEVGCTSDEDLLCDFGSEGLRKWATVMLELCDLAIERDVPLQACGD